jgi:hypothetical protein
MCVMSYGGLMVVLFKVVWWIIIRLFYTLFRLCLDSILWWYGGVVVWWYGGMVDYN